MNDHRKQEPKEQAIEKQPVASPQPQNLTDSDGQGPKAQVAPVPTDVSPQSGNQAGSNLQGPNQTPQNQQGTPKTWWSTNWDKLVIGFLGLVISGVVGFFSGIAAVNKQLSAIETIAKTNEFKLSSMEPNIGKIGNIEAEQGRQKDRIDDLERENQNVATIRGIIQIRDDQIKQATIQYLEEIVTRLSTSSSD